jgi:transposase
MFLTYREIVKENPELARRKLVEIYKMVGTISETARRCGTSRKTVRKIVRRYEEMGEEGLKNFKRAPKRVHNRTPKEIEDRVVEFRKRTGYGPKRLSRILGMSPYTIRNILRRYGLTKPYQVRSAHKGKRVTVYTAEHYAPLQFFR